ncbi:MAG: hypothetical protein IT373_29145 [Polyangiaceae bacterium]|nr:hypothetical protein [Polyangiaceae bacterium]
MSGARCSEPCLRAGAARVAGPGTLALGLALALALAGVTGCMVAPGVAGKRPEPAVALAPVELAPRVAALAAERAQAERERAALELALGLALGRGDRPGYAELAARRLAVVVALAELDAELAAAERAPRLPAPKRPPEKGELEERASKEQESETDLFAARVARAASRLAAERARPRGRRVVTLSEVTVLDDGNFDPLGPHPPEPPPPPPPPSVPAPTPAAEVPNEPWQPVDPGGGTAHVAEARVRADPGVLDLAPLVAANLGVLLECLPERLRRAPLTVDVTVRVDAEGALRNARVASVADPLEPLATACLVSVLERLRLAGYAGEGGVASFPLRLQP